MDLPTISAASRVLVGALLLVAGIGKLLDAHAASTVEGTALRGLLPRTQAGNLWRILGGLEGGFGILGLLPLGPSGIGILLLSGLALAYSTWAWRWRPDKSCGCLGAASSHKSGLTTLARSALLLALAAIGLALATPWWNKLAQPTFWLSLLIGSVAFAVLSPEVRHLRIPQRRTKCLRGHAATRRVATSLPNSQAWQELAGSILQPEPVATWNKECVAFLAFPAWTPLGAALAVFAVGLQPGANLIRGTLIDHKGQLLGPMAGGEVFWTAKGERSPQLS